METTIGNSNPDLWSNVKPKGELSVFYVNFIIKNVKCFKAMLFYLCKTYFMN